jgi:short subunit dehydrogenase-like uncharacterized protein
VDRKVTGPTEEVRTTARVWLWGEVKNAAGATVTATLETPEAYGFTAVSAVASVERLLAPGNPVQPGAWTPSRAFGAHFVDELPGVIAGDIAGEIRAS